VPEVGPTPGEPGKIDNDVAKLRRELSIFFIGLGVLLAIAAYFMLASSAGPTPPPLWGLPRRLAIGVPVAVFAGLHVLCGALLAATGLRPFCLGGAIASTLTTAFYFFFMISATGTVGLNLMTIIAVAIPIMVWSRAMGYLQDKSATR
jgi:hypothetical protein